MNKTQLIVAFILTLGTQIAFGESPGTLTKVGKNCGEYSIKIYEYEEEGTPLASDRLEIYKNNKLVYQDKNMQFRIGLMYDDMPEHSLVNGCQDITGDGQPDLVIATYSGGAHCCFGFKIFQLGKKFKLIDTIDAGDSDLAKFKDVDNDGVLEFIGNDWVFAYWWAPFSGSPAPKIILEYKDGSYRLALDKMKKPLDETFYKQFLQNIRLDMADAMKDRAFLEKSMQDKLSGWSNGEVGVPPGAWGYMLDLIYSGHAKEAWALVDDFWPQGKPGKKEFINDFRKHLSTSQYWDSIKISIEKNE